MFYVFLWPLQIFKRSNFTFCGYMFFFGLSSHFVALEAHVEEQRQIHRFSLRERLRQNRVTRWEVLGHGKGCARPRLSYTPYMSLENLSK